MNLQSRDEKYLKILLDRIAVCKKYKPKFGQSGRKGVSLDEFKQLYGSDLLYSWLGLDNSLMYAAHKAAGGITSVYRQIGIGGEELFRQILKDELDLDEEQANWSYEIKMSSGRTRTLKLDGRVELEDLSDDTRKEDFQTWIADASNFLDLDTQVANAMRGVVMEVRQGYKSKDSKRQNADMANATTAYTKGYLPILVILSSQIDEGVVERYIRGKWLVLRGQGYGSVLESTFMFTKDVIGYDLAGFFERNSAKLQEFTTDVLQSLLETK